MPLLNTTIIRLNEITTLIEDKSNLTSENESLIKQIFREINEKGERYDVDEIESWFENEGSWNVTFHITHNQNLNRQINSEL
jgi:hypothetical protein